MSKHALDLREGVLFPVEAVYISPDQAHLKTFYFLLNKWGARIADLKSLDMPEGLTYDFIDRRGWDLESAIYMEAKWVFNKGTNLCRIKDADLLGDKDYSHLRAAHFRTGERHAAGNCSEWRNKGGPNTLRVGGLPQPLKEIAKEFGNALYLGRRMVFSSNKLKQEIEKTDIRSDELDSLLITLYNYIEYHIGYFLKADYAQELASNLVRVVNSTRQAK